MCSYELVELSIYLACHLGISSAFSCKSSLRFLLDHFRIDDRDCRFGVRTHTLLWSTWILPISVAVHYLSWVFLELRILKNASSKFWWLLNSLLNSICQVRWNLSNNLRWLNISHFWVRKYPFLRFTRVLKLTSVSVALFVAVDADICCKLGIARSYSWFPLIYLAKKRDRVLFFVFRLSQGVRCAACLKFIFSSVEARRFDYFVV